MLLSNNGGIAIPLEVTERCISNFLYLLDSLLQYFSVINLANKSEEEEKKTSNGTGSVDQLLKSLEIVQKINQKISVTNNNTKVYFNPYNYLSKLVYLFVYYVS